MKFIMIALLTAVPVEDQPGKHRYFMDGCEVYPLKSPLDNRVLTWVKIDQDCEFEDD